MFTGIIQSIGEIISLKSHGIDCRLEIETRKKFLEDSHLGDSIAVDGVCLTVIELDESRFSAEVSKETLARTILNDSKVGDRVNLETALTPTSKIGGHLVTGHVDGVGKISAWRRNGRSVRMRIDAPPELAKYFAEKGSICVNGISLTVNHVTESDFEVNIVPHTLSETTLGLAKPGDNVNLEVDLVARYVERLLLAGNPVGKSSGLSSNWSTTWGFKP